MVFVCASFIPFAPQNLRDADASQDAGLRPVSRLSTGGGGGKVGLLLLFVRRVFSFWACCRGLGRVFAPLPCCAPIPILLNVPWLCACDAARAG